MAQQNTCQHKEFINHHYLIPQRELLCVTVNQAEDVTRMPQMIIKFTRSRCSLKGYGRAITLIFFIIKA
jgi:hypothetical protein